MAQGGDPMRRQKPKTLLVSIVLLALLALNGCATPTAEVVYRTVEVQVVEVSTPTETAAPTDTPVPEGVLSPRDLAAFDFVIEKKIEAVPLAGVTLAIRWGSNPVYAKGYGYADLATSTPATHTTVYQIASLTKHFTAAAIMQLLEQGKLALDDPVSKFLPQAPASWKDVRIHHLLNHTSGIPDAEELAPGEIGAGPVHPSTADEVIAGLKDAPLWFEPGSQFKYGGSSYRLLALIIEEVTGLKSEAYFQQQWFASLGLDSTFSCYERFEDVAQGYDTAEGELQPIVSYDPSRIVGPSGLCSSAPDLIRWLQALVEGRIVSADSYQKMITPTLLSNGKSVAYGYGLGIGEHAIAHGGAIPGFRSWMIYYPEDELTIALLSNTSVPAQYSLETLASVIADRILGKRDE
jgi:D-alanyl-D-alanine carboxypeptidase